MSLLKGKKILVVDDEAGIRELLIEVLEDQGAICTQASGGQEGFQIYIENHFDIVLSDINMPGGNGIYLLDQVKGSARRSTRFFIISGNANIVYSEIVQKGVDGVIEKPFNLNKLINKLEASLCEVNIPARKYTRIMAELNIKLNWQELNKPLILKTQNFSLGGLFVQSVQEQMPSLNSKILFEIIESREFGSLNLMGELRVKWTSPQTSQSGLIGFGAEFDNLSEEQLKLLQNINDFHLRKSNSKILTSA